MHLVREVYVYHVTRLHQPEGGVCQTARPLTLNIFADFIQILTVRVPVKRKTLRFFVANFIFLSINLKRRTKILPA